MKEVEYIVKGEYLVTMGPSGVIERGALAVDGGRIIEVGKEEDLKRTYRGRTEIGGPGRAVLPSFVNTHTHAPMVYFRGLADDLPLNEWLQKHIWPQEARWLGPEFIRDATELACLEMLKAGITLYNDMYFFEDASAEVLNRVGMRGVLGAGILDFPTSEAKTTDEYFSKAEGFIQRWHRDTLVVPSVAPHAPYTCSPETYKRAVELAERYDLPVHTHLSETEWEVEEVMKRYGKRPVEHLDSHGVLNQRVVAAHCVWVSEEEIEILAKRGVKVSHCIESNLKLASGIAPVPEMLRAGVRVTFGTDSAASNNDLDILSEMSTAAKVHKAISRDPTVLDAETVLRMATLWGAEALGLADRIGSLETGKEADLIVIDLRTPHLSPIYNIYSHIVYAARGSDIEAVMVRGRLLINEGEPLTIDEEEVLQKARRWAEKIKDAS